MIPEGNPSIKAPLRGSACVFGPGLNAMPPRANFNDPTVSAPLWRPFPPKRRPLYPYGDFLNLGAAVAALPSQRPPRYPFGYFPDSPKSRRRRGDPSLPAEFFCKLP